MWLDLSAFTSMTSGIYQLEKPISLQVYGWFHVGLYPFVISILDLNIWFFCLGVCHGEGPTGCFSWWLFSSLSTVCPCLSGCCSLKQDWFMHLLFSHLLCCDWTRTQSCLSTCRASPLWCQYLPPWYLCLPQQLQQSGSHPMGGYRLPRRLASSPGAVIGSKGILSN